MAPLLPSAGLDELLVYRTLDRGLCLLPLNETLFLINVDLFEDFCVLIDKKFEHLVQLLLEVYLHS